MYTMMYTMLYIMLYTMLYTMLWGAIGAFIGLLVRLLSPNEMLNESEILQKYLMCSALNPKSVLLQFQNAYERT